MEIFLIVFVSLIFILTVLIFLWAIFGHRKKVNKVDHEFQEKCKDILRESNVASECAKASWGLVSSGAARSEISHNTRKRNYSDRRESERFCSALSTQRIEVIDKLDREMKYGQY